MKDTAHADSISIGFGGAALSGEGGGYGFGSLSEKECESLLKFAWDQGVRLYDTAPIYGFGLSEERMGRYLPAEALIVTKGGVHWHESKRVNMTNEPRVMEEMLLASLKRLKREQIDFYMIHWPDAKVDIRRPLELLAAYQQKGVIKKLGLCNTTASDLALAREVANIEALQSELNVLSTRAYQHLAWQDYFSMGWGTFDKGILSGRVKAGRKFDSDDCRSWAPWWNKKEVAEKVSKVQVLQELLNPYDISLQQFSIQFNLRHFGIDCCLVGSKTTEDLQSVLDAARKPIAQEVIHKIHQQWQTKVEALA